MKLTDIDALKGLARAVGLKPSALSGQNFLIDEEVLAAIMASARPRVQENILEIGPGFGGLTKNLLDAGARLLAVENDKKLGTYLAERFGLEPNFKLATDDILQLENQDIKNRFQSWPGGARGGHYRIIANLPYQITGKIIRKFVSDGSAKPSAMAILLQKEVALRLCAGPGRLSLLAIAAQLYSKPKIGFFVPKTAFWPVPKVDSALVEIEEISAIPRYPIRDIQGFWRILRMGFSSPRKQLQNNLRAGLKLAPEAVAAALAAAGLSPSARAQEVSIEQWIGLAETIDKEP